MKHTSLLLLILATLCAGTAMANDSEYFVIGNQLTPMRQTSIRVTKEVLSIDLRDDNSAYIDVYYELTNPESSPKTITMGFEADPPYFCDDNKRTTFEHPYIRNFTVEINGHHIAHKNAISKEGEFRPERKPRKLCIYDEENTDDSAAGLIYVYYFDATFQPGVNKVHHTYHYEMGNSTTFLYFLDYKLTPAARWANGQIDDFTLNVSAKQTAKHFFIPVNCLPGMKPVVKSGTGKTRQERRDMSEDGLEWEVALRKGAIQFHAKNFRPKEELALHSGVLCGGLAATYDRSKFMGDCGWVEHDEQSLRIMRNLPYASRGHVFTDPQLKAFFESCWWYMPDPKYKDDTSDFTVFDWHYINFKPKADE